MGAGKISRRVSDGGSGVNRTEGATPRDCRPSGRAGPRDERGRSGESFAGKPEPKSGAQAEAQQRALQRNPIDGNAGEAEAARRGLDFLRRENPHVEPIDVAD